MKPAKIRRLLETAQYHDLPVSIELGAIAVTRWQDLGRSHIPEREVRGHIAAVGEAGC